MTEIARTWMPEMPAAFRLESDIVQPWVQGYAPPIFTSSMSRLSACAKGVGRTKRYKAKSTDRKSVV